MRPIGHSHMPGSLLKIKTCNILFNSYKNPVWYVIPIIIVILHMRLLELESLSFLYARSHSSGEAEVGAKFGSVQSLSHVQLFATPQIAAFQVSLSITNSWSFSSVQSFSCVRLFATAWIAAHLASLSITNPQSLFKLMSIELVMPSSHLIICRPLVLLLPIPPSIRVFSNESTLRMRWPKYWSFSFTISPSNEHSGLICFMMDWLDLLQSKGLSRVFSNTTVQKHQFFSAQPSSQSNSHIHTWPLEKPKPWLDGQVLCWHYFVGQILCWQSNVSAF